jgi:DASS family divalent anion:Na+ symporter
LDSKQTSRWGIVLFVAVGILLIPVPSGITPQSWRLLAIFAATITGSIVRPIPGAAMVCWGHALPLFRVLPINEALTGYADPFVWLVLAAFFISRGMIKTDWARIAFLFIKAIGKHSLGLAYALASPRWCSRRDSLNRRSLRRNNLSDREEPC